MKSTGQGVLYRSSRPWLLACALLFCALSPASAPNAAPPSKNPVQERPDTVAVVALVYSEKVSLQKDISLELLQQLAADQSGIGRPLHIRLVNTGKTAEQNHDTKPEADMAVVIGANNITLAKNLYPRTRLLFIVTDPGKISLQPGSNRHDILYMTQPFCRQLQFIHLLNPDWRKIGYLTSEQDYPDNDALESCASRYYLRIFRQYNQNSELLSTDLRSALQRTDLLLAFPDRNIYNRKTVKNILLTSYRVRKPVIAFSRSFVNAGAIAAIHSNPRQIASKANSLVGRYLSLDRKPQHREHYPDDFDISINRQVFRAFHIEIPDIREIKKQLNNSKDATMSAFTGISR